VRRSRWASRSSSMRHPLASAPYLRSTWTTPARRRLGRAACALTRPCIDRAPLGLTTVQHLEERLHHAGSNQTCCHKCANKARPGAIVHRTPASYARRTGAYQQARKQERARRQALGAVLSYDMEDGAYITCYRPI
jgi:hypothetical protein